MLSRTVMLRMPPVIGQADPAACWAAALASWLQVTPNRPKYSQADLLGKFDKRNDYGIDPRGIVGRDGGLDVIRGFPQLAQVFMMQWTQLACKDDLTSDLIADKLRRHGHLYLIHGIPGGSWARLIVIFGVCEAGSATDPDLSYVDPEPDNVGSLIVCPLSHFRKRFTCGPLVAWPV